MQDSPLNHLRNTSLIVATFLLGAFLATLFLLPVAVTAAESPFDSNVPLTGYAWSSNIGWISFNCQTGGNSGGNICATSNYKVEIKTDGTLSGYAWSSNIGWIKFGGLSAIPSGPGNAANNAQLVSVGSDKYELQGWVRVCSSNSAAGSCNFGVTRNEGWDGWISLKGTSPNYTTEFTSAGVVKTPVGYAWGSSVVGWIGMTHLDIEAPEAIKITSFKKGAGETLATDGSETYDNVTLVATVTGVDTGKSVPYTVTVNGVTKTGTYKADSPTTGTFTPALKFDGVPANVPVTAILRVGTAKNYDEKTITLNLVAAAATVSLKAQPDLVRPGSTSNLRWTVSSPQDVSCQITGGGMDKTVNIAGGTPDTGSVDTNVINNLTRFTITCSGAGVITTSESTTVSVVPYVMER